MSRIPPPAPEVPPVARPEPGSAEWTRLLEGARPPLRALHRMETVATVADGVTHELNNLLLAIRGNAGLLLMGEFLDPTTRARLEKMEAAAARAAELTRRFQALARPADGKPALIDFNDAAGEAVGLARLVWRRSIHFTFQPAPGPLPVLMDLAQATRTLLALCSNAAEAMTDGGTVTITTGAGAPGYARGDSGPRAEVPLAYCRVNDQGPGIDAQAVTRLFSPLYTTKPYGRGTGLGLATAREAAESHGGRLEIQSIPGAGTMATLFLPLAESSW